MLIGIWKNFPADESDRLNTGINSLLVTWSKLRVLTNYFFLIKNETSYSILWNNYDFENSYYQYIYSSLILFISVNAFERNW